MTTGAAVGIQGVKQMGRTLAFGDPVLISASFKFFPGFMHCYPVRQEVYDLPAGLVISISAWRTFPVAELG